jgi:hypothetical protein
VISLARYSALLRPREFRQTVGASIVGRLPIGITGLAILLLVQTTTGSFARGGAATACYVIGLATVGGMRTYFRQRLRNDEQLSAAYSLESVLIELIFIAGPPAGGPFRGARVGCGRRAVCGRLWLLRHAALRALAGASCLADRAAQRCLQRR